MGQVVEAVGQAVGRLLPDVFASRPQLQIQAQRMRRSSNNSR